VVVLCCVSMCQATPVPTNTVSCASFRVANDSWPQYAYAGTVGVTFDNASDGFCANQTQKFAVLAMDDLATAAAKFDGYWIGLNQTNTTIEPDKGWKWLDGKVRFINWAKNEPNNFGLWNESEDCGALTSGGINDRNCSTLLAALCQIDCELILDVEGSLILLFSVRGSMSKQLSCWIWQRSSDSSMFTMYPRQVCSQFNVLYQLSCGKIII
jgi:hypothetical protein